MPLIHIRAYTGRDQATKIKAATAMVEAAKDILGSPESAFTVVFEDFDPADKQKIVDAEIKPRRDMIVYGSAD
jgi:phenylpyruvate tautomerase PptA (4-oxalocrotonate tautomerase family)